MSLSLFGVEIDKDGTDFDDESMPRIDEEPSVAIKVKAFHRTASSLRVRVSYLYFILE